MSTFQPRRTILGCTSKSFYDLMRLHMKECRGNCVKMLKLFESQNFLASKFSVRLSQLWQTFSQEKSENCGIDLLVTSDINWETRNCCSSCRYIMATRKYLQWFTDGRDELTFSLSLTRLICIPTTLAQFH